MIGFGPSVIARGPICPKYCISAGIVSYKVVLAATLGFNKAKLLYESCVAAVAPPCSAIPAYQVLVVPSQAILLAPQAGSVQLMVHAAGSGSPFGQTFAEKLQLVGPVCILTWYHLFALTCRVLTEIGQVQEEPWHF